MANRGGVLINVEDGEVFLYCYNCADKLIKLVQRGLLKYCKSFHF